MDYEIITKLKESVCDRALEMYQTVKVRITEESPVLYEIVLGAKQIQAEIEEILLKMRVGEEWQVKNCQGTLRIEVVSQGELVDCRPPAQMSQWLKQAGNDSLKQKQYKQAIDSYLRAYQALQHFYSPQEMEIKLAVMSNLALASLNAGEFSEAVSWCNKHLCQTLQPNQKILYRLATAHKNLRDWREAKSDIEKGIKACGQDIEAVGNFKALLEIVEREEREQLQKEKKVYGKMFG